MGHHRKSILTNAIKPPGAQAMARGIRPWRSVAARLVGDWVYCASILRSNGPAALCAMRDSIIVTARVRRKGKAMGKITISISGVVNYRLSILILK